MRAAKKQDVIVQQVSGEKGATSSRVDWQTSVHNVSIDSYTPHSSFGFSKRQPFEELTF